MEQVFDQINVVKLKLNNRMTAELVIMQFEYQGWIEKRQYCKACSDYN